MSGQSPGRRAAQRAAERRCRADRDQPCVRSCGGGACGRVRRMWRPRALLMFAMRRIFCTCRKPEGGAHGASTFQRGGSARAAPCPGCATIRNAAATGNRHEHHVRSTTRAWTCPPRSWPSAASAWAWCTARRRRRCAVIRCPATARWTGAASCGEARDVVSAEFEAATSH